jgi:hypothetical protein
MDHFDRASPFSHPAIRPQFQPGRFVPMQTNRHEPAGCSPQLKQRDVAVRHHTPSKPTYADPA